MHRHRILIGALVLLATTGCATLQGDFETPTVTVSSLRVLPSEGIAPRFEIGLHILNPNREDLSLHGIAYSLALDGHKMITGVTNDLPTIAGYDEGEVTLIAVTSLLNSIRFFAERMNSGKTEIDYTIKAKLDLGRMRPSIYITEKGVISLSEKSP